MSAARDLLGLTQEELAASVGLKVHSISRFELGQTEPHPANRERIQAELERRGIEFTNGTGIGVRLNYEKAAQYARLSDPAKGASVR